MEDIRFYSETDFKIKNIGYLNVIRTKNFSFDCNKPIGKVKFVYVQSGKMKYVFKPDNKAIEIMPHEMLYVPGFVSYHAVYSEEGTTIKSITFDADNEHTPSYIPDCPLKKTSKDISAIFDSITAQNMHSPLFLASKTYELLYIMITNEPNISKKYRKILPAIKEITSNYNKNLKMSYYADLCNMSESNFRKLFKEYTGKSPVEYRNLIRISEAVKLIESNEFTVSEAAYYTGFNNMSFFYDLYRKERNKKINCLNSLCDQH